MHRATLVLALALSACSNVQTGSNAEALSPPAPGNANYLALGDSIAFGFDPNLPYAPPFDKFVGYPEALAADKGLIVANASCPGETSGSFLDPTQPDNGCRSLDNYFAQGIHIDYQGAPSQMAYALAFLAAHPQTELITLDIGGNDLLLAQKACAGNLLCIATKLVTTVAIYSFNLTTILSRLRGAGYHGKIVLLTQYATNYQDAQQLLALTALKDATNSVAPLFGAKVADGFGAFALESLFFLGNPCNAGLLIRNPDGSCDKHPSALGRVVLTGAIQSVLQ